MILSTNFEEYEKGELVRAYGGSLFGTGIFVSDGMSAYSHREGNVHRTRNQGERWKSVQKSPVYAFCLTNRILRYHRSMARPFFSRERISDFEIFNRHADQVVIKMKERFSQGVAVDVQDVLSRFTLDTATEFLFGRDVKSLSAELPYPSTYKGYTRPAHPSDEFASAFNRAQEYSFSRMIYGKSWPLFEFRKDIVAAEVNLTDKFISPLIGAALQRKKEAHGVYELDKEEGSLLDHLVHETDGTVFNSTRRFTCIALNHGDRL